MNKKQQKMMRIILGVIFFTFVVSFSQFIFPNHTKAANELNWDNPNKNGDNPYKISTDAILNSQTMMQVVGCTGLVDKVTSYTTDFLKTQGDKLIQKIWKKKAKDEAKNKSCEAIKAAIVAGISAVPYGFSTAWVDKIDCEDLQKVIDEDGTFAIEQQTKKEEAAIRREECFNGLAYTLAKNQLASMTRQTVNWVNTGFNGNPMYVQNITSLTNSIERNIIETGTERLSNGAFPYGKDFSESLVRSYNTGGIGYGATNFLDSLTSDLGAFITDKDSYGVTYGIDPRTEAQRAQDANNAFSNDFSVGGWDGWLALTQRDQNNPLGFTMLASQYLADRIDQQAGETKDELSQNDGFLSQRICTKWQRYDAEGKPTTKTDFNGKVIFAFSDEKRKEYPDKCIEDKIVTPGSIIKDKLTTYINSPERQLELADTINESLNNLFTNLIEKFRNEGLFGLSREKYSYLDDNMGIGAGYDLGDNEYRTSGGFSGSFELTRDLGNIYIHDDTISLGAWNAKTNIPELNINLAPFDEINNRYYGAGVYYTVSVAGNTKLFNDGYNGWAVGDRAFWNGKEWQNWKKDQTSPIDKRGIIQIQKDYVVGAKEILKMLPSIMPKIGELDYCIPGPNPYYETNSGEATSLFQELAGSLNSIYGDGKFLKRDYTTFSIAKPGDSEFDDYKKIFDGTNPTLFKSLEYTLPFRSLYFLGSIGEVKKDGAEESIQNAVNELLDTINKNIRDFYEQYRQQVFVGIYGTMQSEFLEKENTGELERNSAYLPMINDGYNITKDILNYNEEMAEAIEDYHDSIIQAESNTRKLDAIRKDVSVIIKAAQNRRNEALADALGLSIEEIEKEYAECFAEEDIQFYDDTDIMTDSGGDEASRCFDGIDNDLDGLIDKLDPDCDGVAKGYCAEGKTSSTIFTTYNNRPCTERETSLSCVTTSYYHSGNRTKCEWIKY